MTYDPLRLIQFCLEKRIPLQIVDFAATVAGVSFPETILATNESIDRLLVSQKTILRVEAPVAVGRDLQQPHDQRDVYILIHVPRQALVAMDSPVAESLILRPS